MKRPASAVRSRLWPPFRISNLQASPKKPLMLKAFSLDYGRERFSPWTSGGYSMRCLEGETRTQLNLSPRRRHLCNRTEACCIYETVWRSEIRVIKCIEEFSTGFEMHCLPQRKATHHTYIYRLHCGPNHRVPRSIPECISGWCSKGSWIEPGCGISCTRSKYRLAGYIRPHWVLTKRRACIRRIAEDRDR